jgi:hypothetical protein
MFLSDDDNLDDNLVTTTEFEGLYMNLLWSIIVRDWLINL